VNYANPQEHVPEAEWNNCIIKERVRATFHCLPCWHVSKIMIKILVVDLAKELNFFPAKNSVSVEEVKLVEIGGENMPTNE
jgi:hypothetical protein